MADIRATRLTRFSFYVFSFLRFCISGILFSFFRTRARIKAHDVLALAPSHHDYRLARLGSRIIVLDTMQVRDRMMKQKPARTLNN
jgi:hypothetical protein